MANLLNNVINTLSRVIADNDRFVGNHADYSHYQGWLLDGLILVGINVSLWILSLIVGKCWPVDFIWSSWPGLMAGGILWRSPLKFVSPKQWLFFAAIWFWGLRLTSNFVFRGGIGHEDWRYTEMREQVGRRWFPLLSLPMVFLGQSTFNFLGCLSIYGMLRNRFSTMNATDLVGLSLIMLAVIIETAADEQLDQFVTRRSDNKRIIVVTQTGQGERVDEYGRKQVLDTGLWSWSRHPNYFGECLFWWALWVCGGCEFGPALMGPVAMTILFVFISIPLMEERQLERKGAAFTEYQRKVRSPLIPIPPVIAQLVFPNPPAANSTASATAAPQGQANTQNNNKSGAKSAKEKKKESKKSK